MNVQRLPVSLNFLLVLAEVPEVEYFVSSLTLLSNLNDVPVIEGVYAAVDTINFTESSNRTEEQIFKVYSAPQVLVEVSWNTIGIFVNHVDVDLSLESSLHFQEELTVLQVVKKDNFSLDVFVNPWVFIENTFLIDFSQAGSLSGSMSASDDAERISFVQDLVPVVMIQIVALLRE